AAAVVGFILATTAVRLDRARLYAHAGGDVPTLLGALDWACPGRPAGTIVVGPRPIVRENIAGLLSTSNLESALRLHRDDRGLRAQLTQSQEEFDRAPPECRFDLRALP
ncbi:MAG: hypothetical protein ACRDHY_16080, partial [Anaerolineales bacterium]